MKIAFCTFVSQGEERRPLMSKSGRKLVLKNILLFLTNKCTWTFLYFVNNVPNRVVILLGLVKYSNNYIAQVKRP